MVVLGCHVHHKLILPFYVFILVVSPRSQLLEDLDILVAMDLCILEELAYSLVTTFLASLEKVEVL